jgi:hypothetical protein
MDINSIQLYFERYQAVSFSLTSGKCRDNGFKISDDDRDQGISQMTGLPVFWRAGYIFDTILMVSRLLPFAWNFYVIQGCSR